MNGLNETVVQTSNIASGGVLKGRTYLKVLSDMTFVKDDRIKIKIVSSDTNINGE